MDLSGVLEIVSQTDPGMVRSHNEDSISFDAPHGLVVLADGMGGYNAGEVASGIAVSMLSSELKLALDRSAPTRLNGEAAEQAAVKLLDEHVRRANRSIFQAAQSQPQYAGMGTTLVTALFYNNRVSVAHIGDSRMYRLRGEAFDQITRDHSLLQEQIESGMITKEEARVSQNKNLVTRAMGIDPEVEPEIKTYEVRPGDVYLLCSDGLNDMVEDGEIRLTLATLQSNLTLAVGQLVQMANDNGGRDNVSVILVKVKGDFPAPQGWLAGCLSWFRNKF